MAVSLDDLRRIPVPAVAPRTLLGVGLAAVAALLVLTVTRPPASVPILVAGSDLPSGAPLSDLDIAVRHVDNATGFVAGDEVGDLADWVLASPIAAGEPLLPSQLRPTETVTAPDVIAIELDTAHAVLGLLSPGDHVDIYATSTGPGHAPETSLIARSVFVVDARVAESTVNQDRVELLLAVDRSIARALTTAIHAGELDLVKVGS